MLDLAAKESGHQSIWALLSVYSVVGMEYHSYQERKKKAWIRSKDAAIGPICQTIYICASIRPRRDARNFDRA